MTDTDLRLIERVQAGDSGAFTELVLNYSAYVYRTAFAFLHNETEAEDASQEIFLKAYRSIHRLNDVRAFPAWFKKVISTVCLDRMKGKHPDLVQENNFGSIPATAPGQWERRLELREALGRLSPDEREIVVLYNWQGYSYQEISELLDIPLGTVKSRLYGARIRLRKILSD